jgi:type IV secretion system protein VirD4
VIAALRIVALLAYLVGGVLIGFMLGRLVLIPFAAVAHISHTWQTGVSLAGALVGAFSAYGWWRRKFGGFEPNSAVHGSAHFANADQVKSALGGASGLIVGRENRKGGQLLRYAGQAHLLTIAPTRSGKGVGAIIPNLLTADRSVLCVDPKGENARITAAGRARFGPVYVLDPFEISDQPPAAFNPLAGLSANGLDLAEDAALLADALVHDPPEQGGEAHWNEEAKALIAGVIMHVVCSEPDETRNLATVRDRLTSAGWEQRIMFDAMAKSEAAGGLVRRAANRHLGKSEREAAGVLSSAQRHTHFLDSVRINWTMAWSDFRFADLKEGKATVFLVLPPERLDAYSRWLRLMVAQAIHDLARTPARPAAPVLFLLDEFAAIGRLEPVERAFGLMAGYGLQLWPILQDMHQLWSTYGKRAGTFLSNAGLVQIFNVADVETASWVSKSIGAATMTYQTAGTSTSRGAMQMFETKSTSTSTHLSRRELMTPDEIMRLDSSLEILLSHGAAPAIAAKVRYYDGPEFRGLFTAASV